MIRVKKDAKFSIRKVGVVNHRGEVKNMCPTCSATYGSGSFSVGFISTAGSVLLVRYNEGRIPSCQECGEKLPNAVQLFCTEEEAAGLFEDLRRVISTDVKKFRRETRLVDFGIDTRFNLQ